MAIIGLRDVWVDNADLIVNDCVRKLRTYNLPSFEIAQLINLLEDRGIEGAIKVLKPLSLETLQKYGHVIQRDQPMADRARKVIEEMVVFIKDYPLS